MDSLTYSVIVPTYNVADEIEQTITSFLEQDYAEAEIIIVDGKSTDATLEVAKKLQKRKPGKIDITSGKDRGIYDAMNKGIEIARGEYLLFLGAGDQLCPGILKKMEPQLNFDTELIQGNLINKFRGEISRAPLNPYTLVTGIVHHPAQLTHFSVFQEIGKFNQNYRVAADYVFLLKASGDSRVKLRNTEENICILPDQAGYASQTSDTEFFNKKQKLIEDNLGTDYVDYYYNSGQKYRDFLKHGKDCQVSIFGKKRLTKTGRTEINSARSKWNREINIISSQQLRNNSEGLISLSGDNLGKSDYLILYTYLPRKKGSLNISSCDPGEILPATPFVYSNEFMQRLEEPPEDVIIFGCGKQGQIVYEIVQEFNRYSSREIQIKCFFDNYSEQEQFNNINIQKPKKRPADQVDCILLASQWAVKMKDQLLELNVEPDKIVAVESRTLYKKPVEEEISEDVFCNQGGEL